MKKIYIVEHTPTIFGKVKVSGSKNAALPILIATLLCNEKCIIENVPEIGDVKTTVELLLACGAKVNWNKKEKVIEVDPPEDCPTIAPYKIVSKMRASILVLGPFLSKYKRALVYLPGGCSIGPRPINLHLMAMSRLGAEIDVNHGHIKAQVKERLKGNTITFPKKTVGGTQNAILAAVLAKGTTIIENAAQEPEVVELVKALKQAGAKIEGEGTSVIKIKGVEELSSFHIKIVPDRIEAGTFLGLSATIDGEIVIENVPIYHMESTLKKFKEMELDMDYNENEDIGTVYVRKKKKLKGIEVSTEEYPGFPTDMQPIIMAACLKAQGCSIIRENIFDNRFIHVNEFIRLGANISIEKNTALVHGVEKLTGAVVEASDLRAGAALVIACASAEGRSYLLNVEHIERGYENFEQKLSLLGIKIEKILKKEEELEKLKRIGK
jgi:UDP-N-acetylglucosamine 1-carboxyvinyltransferase